MAASMRTQPGSQSKTAQTCSSPAPQFFTRKIIPKRFANYVASKAGTKSILARLRLAYLCRTHYRLGFCGSFSHHFVSLRNAHNFFDGCFALGHASPAVIPQSLHAFGDGALLQLVTIALLHDQLPHRLRDETNFINRRTTLVAGLAALITTSATPEAGTEFFYRETDLGKIVARIINHFDTVGTNRAHQPLRDKRLHDRGEQKGFHVHAEQTRNATYGIIRVEGAENKVASHGRAN